MFKESKALSCICSLFYSLPFPLQLNPTVNTFQRKYVNEVKKCEEMERILGKCFSTCQCSANSLKLVVVKLL